MEKRELIRKEILYYIEKNSRANLGRTGSTAWNR